MTKSIIKCVCKQCGGSFNTPLSHVKWGAGVYCSRECTDLGRRKKIECICKQCGKTFMIAPSRFGANGRPYCSRECYEQSRPKKAECICGYCGISFYEYPNDIDRGHGKYCSKKCMGLGKSGEKHPHWRGGHSNYRGPNWNRQRKAAYERDNGTCQYCGKKPKQGEHRCEVHHIIRFMDFNGDYIAANQLTNLITLCQHCHQQAEYGKIPIQRPLL